MEFLTKKTAKDLINEDETFQLVWIEDTATIATALETLKKADIISVPVRDRKSNRFIGALDMLDLVTACVAKFSTTSMLAVESYRQMEEFAGQKAKDILHISGRNAWDPLDYRTTLDKVAKKLAEPNTHRVWIINEVGDAIGVITQYRFVKYLLKNADQFGNMMKMKVASFMNTNKPLQTVGMNTFVISAFQRIWDYQVSGLAVTDDSGKLVGNISATDLKKTRVSPIGELIHDLYQPIKQFLGICTSLEEKVKSPQQHKPIIALPEDSIGSVMETVVESHIHRVYMVNNTNDYVPLAVISLCDIIAGFA